MALDSMIYGTDYIATHSFSEGAETKHVERVAPAAGVLGTWDDDAFITAVGMVNSLTVNTTGKGRIVVGCIAVGASDTSFKFRLVFSNSNGDIVGVSAEAESYITTMLKEFTTNNYYGTMTVFANDVGASSVKMYATTLPASAMGTYVYVAAI